MLLWQHISSVNVISMQTIFEIACVLLKSNNNFLYKNYVLKMLSQDLGTQNHLKTDCFYSHLGETIINISIK